MKKILLILGAVLLVGFIGLSFFKIPAPSAEVRQAIPVPANS